MINIILTSYHFLSLLITYHNPRVQDVPAEQSGDQDHDVYGNAPGQNSEWDGNKQCQLLMKTRYARYLIKIEKVKVIMMIVMR